MNQAGKKEVEYFIENRLLDFESYNISETSDYDLMEAVLISLDNAKRNYDESMEGYIIESYEIFVSENISENSSTYLDLMGILSLQKYIYYAFVELDSNDSNDNRTTLSKWNCGHRDCWDCCMWRTYREYNWVDIAQMVLTPIGPAGDVAWRGTSCAWDCW